MIVETRALVADSQTMHAVEVDEHGTALRALCGTVRVEDIDTLKRHSVPTCHMCLRADALAVRCPKSSPRWLDLEMRRIAAEPWTLWLAGKKKAEREAEAWQADAERKRAEAADRERARQQRQMEEEQLARATWRRTQHVSLTARELEWAEVLRRDWAEHDMLDEGEQDKLIHSAPGDCGKKHLSFAAACACANVRQEDEERRATRARVAKLSIPAGQHANPSRSSSVAGPRSASVITTSATSTRTSTPPATSRPSVPRTQAPAPTEAPALREQAVPPRAPRPRAEHVVPGEMAAVQARPASKAAAPPAQTSRLTGTSRPTTTTLSVRRLAPPGDAEAATLAERILGLVRTGSYMSVNGIARALVASGHGARRQDVYAAVSTMLGNGRLAKVNELFRDPESLTNVGPR